MRLKIERVLATVANVAAIVICIAVVMTAVGRYVMPIAERNPIKPGLQAGSVFPALPGISYGDRRFTVAVFLNSRCIACQQSLPDYERLGDLAHDGKGTVLVCGVFREESDQAIADFGFHLPVVRVKDLGSYNVAGTPTIVLIDQSGKVREFWVGKLTKGARENLIRLIKET